MAIFQVVLNQQWLLQQVRNVLHYESVPDAVPAAEFQELADLIRDEYDLRIGQFVNSWRLDDTTMRRVDLPDLAGFDVPFTAGAITGTNAADSVATQIALLASGVIAGVAPPNRIRQYVGGMVDTSIVNSQFLVATTDIIQLLVEGLNAFATATVVWERQAVRYDPLTGTVVENNGGLAYTTTTIPATQRRRRLGVGI